MKSSGRMNCCEFVAFHACRLGHTSLTSFGLIWNPPPAFWICWRSRKGKLTRKLTRILRSPRFSANRSVFTPLASDHSWQYWSGTSYNKFPVWPCNVLISMKRSRTAKSTISTLEAFIFCRSIWTKLGPAFQIWDCNCLLPCAPNLGNDDHFACLQNPNVLMRSMGWVAGVFIEIVWRRLQRHVWVSLLRSWQSTRTHGWGVGLEWPLPNSAPFSGAFGTFLCAHLFLC